MRKAAVLGAVVVFVLGALFVVRPFVATQRDMPAEIPSPASLLNTDTVPLEQGHPVCFSHAVAERHGELIRFRVAVAEGVTPPLSVHLKGPGYEFTAQIPPGLQDTQTAQAPIPAPPTDVPVRVCIRSRGGPAIGLFASSDRARSRSIAHIDGTSTDKSVWFSFYEPRWRAISERVPLTIDRMTVFRPGYVTSWVLWIIAILFFVGGPIGVVWALVRALRDDGAGDLRQVDVETARPAWRRFLD
jgi:hypothetical protein